MIASAAPRPHLSRTPRSPLIVAMTASLAIHGALAAVLYGFGRGSGTAAPPAIVVELVRLGSTPGEAAGDAPAPAEESSTSSAQIAATLSPAGRRSAPESVDASKAAPPTQPPMPAPKPAVEGRQSATPVAPETALLRRIEAAAPPPEPPAPEVQARETPVPASPPLTSPASESPVPSTAADSTIGPDHAAPAGVSRPQLSSLGASGAGAPARDARPRNGNRPPVYPRQARRRGIEGDVLLAVTIGADGASGEIAIERSSGHDVLDDAAVAAVRSWRFEPATVAGKPVAGRLLVPIAFRLE